MNRVGQIYELIKKFNLPDVAIDIFVAVQASEWLPFEPDLEDRKEDLLILNRYLNLKCKKLYDIAISTNSNDTYYRGDRVAMHKLIEYACRHFRDMVEEYSLIDDPDSEKYFFNQKWS